jgi:hypothetical protein
MNKHGKRKALDITPKMLRNRRIKGTKEPTDICKAIATYVCRYKTCFDKACLERAKR